MTRPNERDARPSAADECLLCRARVLDGGTCPGCGLPVHAERRYTGVTGTLLLVLAGYQWVRPARSTPTIERSGWSSDAT